MPTIEIYTTNRSIDNNTPLAAVGNTVSAAEDGFWRTLGIYLNDPLAYYDQWLTIFHVDRSGANKNIWRALVDRQYFLDTESLNGHGENENHAMSSNLKDGMGIGCLGTMLALQAHSEDLADRLLDLRRDLSPILSGALEKSKHWKAGRLFSKMNSIRNLEFLVSRLRAELSRNELTDHFSSFGFTKLNRRSMFKEAEQVTLVQNLFWQFDRLNAFNADQLRLLKSSYDDYVNSEIMRGNTRVQSQMLVLTFLMAILALVMLVPENARDNMLQSAKQKTQQSWYPRGMGNRSTVRSKNQPQNNKPEYKHPDRVRCPIATETESLTSPMSLPTKPVNF